MDETPPLQLILPTDKRNPCFSLYLDEEEKNLHVSYGLELLEVVPNDPEDSACKLLAGRLYNAGLKVARRGESNQTGSNLLQQVDDRKESNVEQPELFKFKQRKPRKRKEPQEYKVIALRECPVPKVTHDLIRAGQLMKIEVVGADSALFLA
ncbi:MAG: hypothetical protein FJ403_24300 [Verrucomicrobia bacterium]|nr:hypothetical protein [Verrucomicrobiota bacterium]